MGTWFFLEERIDILIPEAKYIKESVTGSVMKVKNIWQDQYSKCFKVSDVCHRSIAQEQTINLQPTSSERTFERKSVQLMSISSDCNSSLRLYYRPYLAYQVRDGNVNKLFCHKNRACTPSPLPLGGAAYVEVEAASSEESPPVDAQFLDGAAEVQKLNHGTAKTFLDCAVHVFCSICIRKPPLALTLLVR